MVLAYARRGLLERFALAAFQPRASPFQLATRQLELGDARNVDPVKAFRVLEHRRVAPRAHVGENRRDRAFYLVIQGRVERGELREPLAEVALSGRKSGDLRHE